MLTLSSFHSFLITTLAKLSRWSLSSFCVNRITYENKTALYGTELMPYWIICVSHLWTFREYRNISPPPNIVGWQISDFDGIMMLCGDNNNSSTRSWDLPPLDYFLWGFLSQAISIYLIQPDLFAKIMENWTFWSSSTQKSLGGYLSDVILHT